MKRIIAISSVALMVGLATGCSNEKTAKTDEPKTASVQKEKELAANDIFKKAIDEFKKEEQVTMTYDINIQALGTSKDMKMKSQLEPNKGNSRSEMNAEGTDAVVFDVDGKLAVEVKDPNSGQFITIPADQLNQINTNDLKISKNTMEEFDKALKMTDKMKVETVGDKYKLTLQLKGQEAKDLLMSINANAAKALEQQQATVDSMYVDYIITKEFKLESNKVDAKMKIDKETVKIIGDTKISYDEKFDPIQLPEEKK
ncbi:hypothetical protein COE51_12550 [Bacillus pseudomycoides]|nr:hypothetical protein COE51_12550 [Bacillus pseudomycoides]